MAVSRLQRALRMSRFIALTLALIAVLWIVSAFSSHATAGVFAAAVPVTVSATGTVEVPDHTAVIAAAVLYLLSTFTLFLRRRLPWLVLGIALFGTLVLQFDALMTCMVAASVIARREGAQIWVAAGLAAAASLAAGIRDAMLPAWHSPTANVIWAGDPDSIIDGATSPAQQVFAFTFAVFSVGIAIGYGFLLRSRRQTADARRQTARERDRNRHLQHETERLSERERLAREVHDTLAHRLSLISMHSYGLENAAASSDPRLATTARVLQDNARESLNDLRGLIDGLRSPVDAAGPTDTRPPADSAPSMPRPENPLQEIDRPGAAGSSRPAPARTADASTPGAGAPAPGPPRPLSIPGRRRVGLHDLGSLIGSSRQAGLTIHPDIRLPHPDTLDPRLSAAAFRIAQESLTNVHRHAPESPVWLSIAGTPEHGLHMRIVNRIGAPGALSESGSGTGIAGMRERAALLGGRSSIGADGRGGFAVEVWLPWRPE